MKASRLSLAIEREVFAVPDGRIAVFRPSAGTDLHSLPKSDVNIIQGFRPDYDWFSAQNYTVTAQAGGDYSAALVYVTRHKSEVRACIAKASAHVENGGAIVVDGQKTDGADSLIKELRSRVGIGEVLSKAHGKLAVFKNPGAEVFLDWAEGAPRPIEGGFVTHPAAFSSDAIDPGSKALAEVLPAKLPALVGDIGAGWGYLSAQALKREGVAQIHLIEAEYSALEAARQNLNDPRAHYHWADATRFLPEVKFGAIVMNPPFHQGRDTNPNLGRSFILAAKESLNPSGTLWMVANRHLPYAQTLAEAFREVEELNGPASYRLYRASGVKSQPRKRR